jgi:hypothetical protein
MTSGPKPRIIPNACSVVELKDLGDVLDFDKEGEVGEVYGFELDSAGLYKRKVIDDVKDDADRKYPKLGQLRDITVPTPPVSGEHYYFKHANNKWVVAPLPAPALKIDWDIKFEFMSPYVMVDDVNLTFKKAFNIGPFITSLVPIVSRDRLKLKEYQKRRYVLTGKPGAINPIVEFTPGNSIFLPDEATLVFELILKPSIGVTESVIARGIKLTWDDTIITQATKVFIAIRKSAAGVDVSSSIPAVKVVIDKTTFVLLSYIDLSHIELVAFYYDRKLYTVEELQNVITD